MRLLRIGFSTQLAVVVVCLLRPPIILKSTKLAAIAIIIKNFDNSFNGVNTSALTPIVIHTVVTTAAMMKYKMNIGNALFKLNLFDAESAFPDFTADFVRIRDNTSVIGIIASVRVSFTVTTVFSVSLPRFHILSQVEAAAVTEEVSLIAVPANNPKELPLVVLKPSALPSTGKSRAGEILRKRLMTMKNDQLAIMNEIRNESHKMESLSIGVTMTIGEYAIVDKIADFLISHPEINLHIHYGNTTQLLTLLDEGRINLALVEGNYPKENYEHKNYSTEEYIAVCARDHTLKEKFPETMQELVKERLLVREPGSGTRNILEELLLARGMGIKDFLHYTEVENMHTIIGLLKRDCGISFMYKIAVAEEIKRGTLKEIRFSDFKMQHDFDFIWEKGSIYTEKYIGICEELLKNGVSYID